MPRPEFDCTLEVRKGVVFVTLRGALRASEAGKLAELARAGGEALGSQPVVADLSGLEVADALGVAALQELLSRFTRASAVLPPPWAQAAHLVRTNLHGVELVERLSDLARPYGAERRRHPRVAARNPAELDLGEGRLLQAVVTRDISRGGARLAEVREERALGATELQALVPDRVRIAIEELDVTNTPARIVHASIGSLALGVAFLSPPRLPLRRLAQLQP